jgi:hypothetical protein
MKNAMIAAILLLSEPLHLLIHGHSCQLSETLAPAFLNEPKSRSASCFETIGS